jgi:predicted KAP-like P-loop ATPase
MMDLKMDDLTFDEDDFARKPIAEKLIQLLINDIDISPLVINGEWGTGKTYFCKKTKNLIDKDYNDKLLCTYIDAFSADHANEPLLTIITAIYTLIKNGTKKKSLLKATKSVASYLVKATGKAGVAFILKTQGDKVADEIAKAIEEASKDSINFVVDNLIQQHDAIEKNIGTLKTALCEISQNKKLVILVDELDRCKPDFSISMLEVIKHIFDVPNIKFVLVCNYNQLEASIKNCYGSNINAHHYLDKFIKYNFELPTVTRTNQHSNIQISILHGENLIKNKELLNKGVWFECSYFIKELIGYNKLSLREVETFIRYFSIYIIMEETQPNRFSIREVLAVYFIFIYAFNPTIKEKIRNKTIKANDLCEILGITHYQKNKHLSQISNCQAMAAYLTIILNDGTISNFTSEDKEDLSAWYDHFQCVVPDGEHGKSRFFTDCEKIFNKLMFKQENFNLNLYQ